MPPPPCYVINGNITVESGQSGVNYIGLAGLGFERLAADEWYMPIKFHNWTDYKALLENMAACGVNNYSYNPAPSLIYNHLGPNTYIT